MLKPNDIVVRVRGIGRQVKITAFKVNRQREHDGYFVLDSQSEPTYPLTVSIGPIDETTGIERTDIRNDVFVLNNNDENRISVEIVKRRILAGMLRANNAFKRFAHRKKHG